MKSAHLLVVLAALGAGCSGSTEPQPLPTGSEVILELGQSARLGETPITVTFKSVEDSRCAIGYQCVWEGNGRVLLELAYQAGPEIAGELNTHPNWPAELTFRYVRVSLQELNPYPVAGAPPAVYRARLGWSYLPD